MRIQWRYQPCPCLLAGGLASIWEAVSPLFSTSLLRLKSIPALKGLKYIWPLIVIVHLISCWKEYFFASLG